MPIDKKKIIKYALDLCVTYASATDSPVDDVIVKSAVAILTRLFNLED